MATLADRRIHPAVCPTCRAPARGELSAAPGVPFYACGSTPYMSVCAPLDSMLPDVKATIYRADPNLETPTAEDLDRLAELLGVVAVAHILPPVVGLCSRCDSTAIDGLCLDHA